MAVINYFLPHFMQEFWSTSHNLNNTTTYFFLVIFNSRRTNFDWIICWWCLIATETLFLKRIIWILLCFDLFVDVCTVRVGLMCNFCRFFFCFWIHEEKFENNEVWLDGIFNCWYLLLYLLMRNFKFSIIQLLISTVFGSKIDFKNFLSSIVDINWLRDDFKFSKILQLISSVSQCRVLKIFLTQQLMPTVDIKFSTT